MGPLTAYDKAIEIGSTNSGDNALLSQAWEGKGYDSARLGRYNESFYAFNKSIELEPMGARALFKKGTALNALGRNSEANDAFAKAKELGVLTITAAQNSTAEGWFNKGQELIGNGSEDDGIQALDKALQLYNESIKQNPKDANAWLGKGNAFVILDFSKNNLGIFNGSQSLAAYDEALKIDPKNIDALIAKGFVLFEMGFSDKENYNRSLEAFDRALQIDPKNPKAWELKGRTLFVTGRYNESLESHDKAIENIGRYNT